MQDSAPPRSEHDERPGRWVAEEAWPSPRIGCQQWTLGSDRLLVPDGRKADERPLDVQSPVTLGLASGKWCSYANGPDLAGDQRDDDGGALAFQTEPLDEPVEILGAPEVELELAFDQEIALVAVRLSDMWPDHQVTGLSYGLLNLTHRDSGRRPELLTPGKRYRVTTPLNYIGERIPAGHRIRLSQIEPPRHEWTVRQDLASQESVLHVLDDRGTMRLEDSGLTVSASAVERYSAIMGDVASASGETVWRRSLSRGQWRISTRTRTRLYADAENFYIDAELDAFEGETRIWSKNWTEAIPRDHV